MSGNRMVIYFCNECCEIYIYIFRGLHAPVIGGLNIFLGVL
jgi:hypothetical protein